MYIIIPTATTGKKHKQIQSKKLIDKLKWNTQRKTGRGNRRTKNTGDK